MIYLDNAATTYPKPEAVYQRIDHILRHIGGNPGRSAHSSALEASRVIFHTREVLSRLLNIRDASRLVFTKNATEAINLALKGILRPGDHVVTTSFEHNSVARTLRRLESMGVETTRVRARRYDLVEPSDIEGALTGRTSLVVMTHASNVLGTIQPIGEIGSCLRKRGIPLMVDGAQSVGAMGLDVEAMDIDILAGTGHKALFGPQGTGFLYIREGLDIPPLVDGGTGDDENEPDMPDRLETGTLNTPGIGGLGAGVEFILKEDIRKIREHEEGLLEGILRGLEDIEGIHILGTKEASQRVGLVSFTMEGIEPEKAGLLLDREFSIMVRCGTHCAPDAHRTAGTFPHGTIRVSPGYFNTHEDIEDFLRAIREIRKGIC